MKESVKRYGRTPAEVLCDPALSDRASRLYGIIAMHAWEGATVSLGMRRLAGMLPKSSRSSVQRLVKELIRLDYIKVAPGANGKRMVYVLPSQIFAQKQGKVTVVRSSPSGGKRMVSVAPEDIKAAG